MTRFPELRWYDDVAAWRLILLGYLPWLAALNLAWELAQLPLYTLWSEGSAPFIAFSVAHCTTGDVMIGGTVLLLALVATRAPDVARWRTLRVGLAAGTLGTAYTVFSEWANTVAAQNWTYSELMPIVRVSGIEIGVSPLAQWLLLPPLALMLSRRRRSGPAYRARRTT